MLSLAFASLQDKVYLATTKVNSELEASSSGMSLMASYQ